MDEQNREFKPVKLFSTCYYPPDMDVSGRAPIIFIHGFLTTNRTWNSVKFEVSKKTGRKVYSIDLRNHGKSEWLDEFLLPYLIDDLENFMVTQNIPKAILVGHSLGGRTALGLSNRRPEMVEKLVVEDIGLEDTGKSINALEKLELFGEGIQQILELLPSTMTETQAQKKIQVFVANAYPEWIEKTSAQQSVAFPFHKEKSGKFVWDINLDAISKLKPSDNNLFWVDLKSESLYRGEMMVLIAENSAVVSQNAADLYYKYFPQCQLHYFKDGYHTLHVEFPQKYIEIVSEFINEK